MTTQTMVKTRQTGAQEAQRPSMAMPEPVNPACKRLQKGLSDYQSALAQIEESRGKVSRAEADEDRLLSDSAVSEKESLARLPEFASRKKFHESRARGMEARAAGLLAELREALVSAMREQTNQVRGLIERRRESIIKAVYAVLGVENAPSIRGEVIRTTRVAPAIMSLESLMPGNFYEVPKLAPEGVVLTAQNVLRNQETLLKLSEEGV